MTVRRDQGSDIRSVENPTRESFAYSLYKIYSWRIRRYIREVSEGLGFISIQRGKHNFEVLRVFELRCGHDRERNYRCVDPRRRVYKGFRGDLIVITGLGFGKEHLRS